MPLFHGYFHQLLCLLVLLLENLHLTFSLSYIIPSSLLPSVTSRFHCLLFET